MDPGDSSALGRISGGESIRQSLGGENDREERRGSILVCEDLRALFLDDDERVVSVADQSRAITATFTVFDGHGPIPRAVFANRGGWNT